MKSRIVKNQKLQQHRKNYFVELKESWLDPAVSLWEIINRIDEFYDVIDAYLQKLENRFIITRKSRKEFLQRSFQLLYEEIYLNAIIAIEGLDLWKEWIEEENNLLDDLKNKLKELEERTLEELRHTMEPVVFTPLKIEHVWFSSKRKDKGSERQEPKKPGRPKQTALQIV